MTELAIQVKKKKKKDLYVSVTAVQVTDIKNIYKIRKVYERLILSSSDKGRESLSMPKD